MTLKLTIFGTPVAQPRPKAARRGNFVQIYTPDTANSWKWKIAKAFKQSKSESFLQGQPLRIYLRFFMPRPKTHFKSNGELKETAPTWCPKKPDYDNLEKAVCDALTDCGAYHDDAQIVDTQTQKLYAAQTFERCEIVLQHVTSKPIADIYTLVHEL